MDLFIKILEIIIILVNILALIFAIAIFFVEYTSMPLFLAILLTLSNLYFIAIHKKISKNRIKKRGKGWISLILKRKILEEKKKIADIESQLKSNN